MTTITRPEDRLKPFQRIGVDFLVANKAALLADEMRLGKTVQTICALNRLKARKILIVCPATVKLGWAEEFKVWSDFSMKVHVAFGSKARLIDLDSHVIIINYDLLVYKEIFNQLRKMRFDVGVFDESHYLKSRTSKRTKAVFLRGAIASRCEYKWFLTGTPILNRPVELYPLLKAVAPHVIHPYTTHTYFANHFCGGYWDGFRIVDSGATNKEELNRRLQGFMLRRTKKEVFSELPEPDCQLIPMPAEGTIKALIAKELTWSKTDAKYQKNLTEADEISIVRHKLAIAKVPTAIKHIKYLLSITDKIVVFAYHRDVLKGLNDGLRDYNPVMVHGGISSQNRHRLQTMFQTDPKTRVFIGQYVAAGVGIDLSAASTIVFVESSWVPGEIEQAMARCDNLSKVQQVLVQFLVVEDSMEEHMLRTVIDKKQTIKDIIEPEMDIFS